VNKAPSKLITAAVVIAAFSVGCRKSQPAPPDTAAENGTSKIVLKSSAFAPGGAIPVKYTGDGADVSPPLSWSNLPEGTQELALIVDDPDAPSRKPWVHWVVYNIQPTGSVLPEGFSTKGIPPEAPGFAQGVNSWGTIGYRGPSPPPGPAHRYCFRLYTLDKKLDIPAGLNKEKLLKAIDGHVLGTDVLTGTYERR